MNVASTTALARGSIRFDVSAWPVVVVEVVGMPTDEEFARYLRELERYMTRGRNVTIVDLSRAERPNASQREMQARWLEKHDEVLRRLCAGVALVITSPLVRGAATAIMWIHRPSHPMTVVKTMAEARAWASTRLAG